MRAREKMWAVLLATLALAVYARTSGFGFVPYDDHIYFRDNPAVRGGLSFEGVRWALTAFHAANWHPLTWLSSMLDVSLFGMRPGAMHLVNAVVHAISAALLFAALRGMTGAAGRSAFVAAVFAAHPLHVESVAWLSQRKDVLAGLFFALTLVAYHRYARRPSAWRMAAVTALFSAGLASKPTLVTMPAVLLALDFWPLNRVRRPVPIIGLLREKIPLLVLSGASAAVTIAAQSAGGAMWTLDELPLPLRVATALRALWLYLAKALFPVGLTLFYPYDPAPSPVVTVGLALLVTAATAAVIRGARRRPSLAAGWLWYLFMLLPVLGIVQVGAQPMADRYTYLSLTGVLLMAAWGLPEPEREARRVAAGAAAWLFVGVLATAAFVQAGYWRDGETLFRRAVSARPDAWLAHASYGLVLSGEGRFREAEAHYREALAISPAQIDTRYNLALVLARQGKDVDAAAEYRAVLGAAPDHLLARFELGLVLVRLADLSGAEEAFRECLRRSPGFVEARYQLGVVLGLLGLEAEAARELRAVIHAQPDFAEAHYNLGVILLSLGREVEGRSHLAEAARLRPGIGGGP